MKPRSYITDGSEMLIGVGMVHAMSGPDEDKVEPAGRLWVPDPEQRSGFREHYIQKPPTEKPGARPLGFGRPR